MWRWKYLVRGVFPTKTLGVVVQGDQGFQMPTTFKAVLEPALMVKLKTIPLLSHQVRTIVLLSTFFCKAELLELIAKSRLGGFTISTITAQLFGSRPDVIPISPSAASHVMNGFVFADSMKDLFVGVSTENAFDSGEL
ncbi:hypothetical protein JG688_00016367 [Phytophthora aleatoria]|uniref:Uncharacterized protein n=1 Tax=Phytophthora aleatoria TaxID=2496075 RepID=A0A8J5IJ05_9STRA|nr:hypothetical protein JG688_00016367 [Phytophthora aleatoria]